MKKDLTSNAGKAPYAAVPARRKNLGMGGKLLLVCMAMFAAVSVYDSSAQNSRAAKRKEAMETWKKDMAEFRSRSKQDNELRTLVDSLSFVQASAAIGNMDFVLEADNVSFKNGRTAFVNSNTNFIAVKGKRATVQISPSDFASGPNGLGGVTVDGAISGMKVDTDRKGGVTVSMNVSGIGINAQVEIYMNRNTNQASATVNPNFNSRTVYLSGKIIPYENSTVIQGRSL